jgi:lipopolysaccharide biosynthesis glycosyltransferase
VTKARPIIVSGADSGYFELLQGCIRSIRDKPKGARISLGVLDVGLGDSERGWLEERGAVVVAPGWDFDFPDRDSMPRHRQAQYARPFLPRHFPGHDLYLWIDADAWVQDWAAIDLFLRAAAEGKLAIVPEMDRSYRNFFHAFEEFHGVISEGYRAAFDEATATRLGHLPLLNNGVFALPADAPHWRSWAETLAAVLRQTRNALIDQTTLNHVVYEQHLPAHFLPAWCNWICHHAAPFRDAVQGVLTEPNLPHQKLGIVHLTMWMKSRLDLRYGCSEQGRG